MISKIAAPVRKQTVVFLRNAIVDGKLKPNQWLKERELCEMVGVSRTTIREALRHLESEGLIRHIYNKGFIVASITTREVKDIYQLRQVLEALACKVFAETATEHKLNSLEKTFKKLKNTFQNGSGKELTKAKDQFYEVLFGGLENKLVSRIIRNLHRRISFLRFATLSRPGRPPESIKELEIIINAIKKRDPDESWKACVDHVLKAEAVALDIFSRLQKDSENQI